MFSRSTMGMALLFVVTGCGDGFPLRSGLQTSPTSKIIEEKPTLSPEPTTGPQTLKCLEDRSLAEEILIPERLVVKIQEREEKSPEKKAPNSPEAQREEETVALPRLTFEETQNFILTLRAQLEGSYRQILEIRYPMGAKASDIEVTPHGTHEDFHYALKIQGRLVVEFKNQKLSLAEATRVDQKPYVMGTVCVGSDCEILLVAIYKLEGSSIVENYPTLFKKINGQYRPHQLMEKETYLKESESRQGSVATEKLPPQLRVGVAYEENIKKHGEALVEKIRKSLTQENKIYSARILTNKSCAADFEKSAKGQSGVRYSSQCLENQDFKFQVDLNTEKNKGTGSDGIEISSEPIVPGELYLVTFQNQKFDQVFKTPLENAGTAVFAELCQILVEGQEIYSRCQYFPSSLILGAVAIEGRYEGPMFAAEVKGQPVVYKTRAEIPKKEAETVGF